MLTGPPTCTTAVLTVLHDNRPLEIRAVHACLGDSINREGRPVTITAVQTALQWLVTVRQVERVGRRYRRVAADPLSRTDQVPLSVS